MALTIDLNADLGEGFGRSRLAEDEALLDLVSSANIACGFHAGNATTMKDTVRSAKRRGVTIGAHPSYPDLPGFGRRELGLPPREIAFHVVAQLRTLTDVCTAQGAELSYVKPHGALYNRAARDAQVASAIVSAIGEVSPTLTLLGLADSAMQRAAQHAGLPFAREAFVDRAYQRDGTLVPRTEPGAIIGDLDEAVDRALRLIMDRVVTTADGHELRLEAQSLCVHGDNPDAASLLGILRSRLEGAGVTIAPFAP